MSAHRTCFSTAAVCCALATLAGSSGTAAADPPVTAPACETGQVKVVGAQQMSPGLGHRGYRIFFVLAPGRNPCSLTGYPGVDTTGADPVVHAERTPNGYLGGLFAEGTAPPTVLLDKTDAGMAEVEWVVADKNGNSCPPYPGIEVWPPETTASFRLPAGIDYACGLQVHPVMEPDVVPVPDPDLLPE